TRPCPKKMDDLADAERVIGYCGERIFENKPRPSKEKALSLSVGTAGFIKKGGREPVIVRVERLSSRVGCPAEELVRQDEDRAAL
ncbi:MAG: hypothetical protein WD490_08055, partial [Opitutales bacterium]